MDATAIRPKTKFDKRNAPYYDFKRPEYQTNKSLIGKIGFIVYYISILTAIAIAFTNKNMPLITTAVIFSYVSLMLIVNYSKFDVPSLSIALISGLITIILLWNHKSESILQIIGTVVASLVYLLSSLKTVYTSELKEIVTLVR